MQNAVVTPFPHEDLSEAQRVITIESQALLELAKTLDDTFVRSVDQLHQTRGRVIISGIGKSGHVAHKIASTFSSLGTPAFFVHPSEASHGDLGMITPDDTLIVLSLSGSTAELSDMLNYAKRFDIPLIATPHNSKPWANLIPKFPLDVIKALRQIPVSLDKTCKNICDDFLSRRTIQHLTLMTIFHA